MPLPIQLGSLTDRLRKLFRITGRTRFALDETVVPVVVVQDLTVGPYQAGVIPAAGTISFQTLTAGSQVAIMMNPGSVALLDTETDEFRGRSWTTDILELLNRSAEFLVWSAFIVDRNTAIPPIAVPASIVSLVETQLNRFGDRRVPVVLAEYPGGLIVTPAAKRIWQQATNSTGTARDSFRLPPGIVLGPTEALVFDNPFGPAAASNAILNASGIYQPQPA